MRELRLDKLLEVQGEVFMLFRENFSKYEVLRSTMDGVSLSRLSLVKVEFLSARIFPL